jgi:ferredoxin
VPTVVIHRGDKTFEGEVNENTNLVVKAGIRQFPYPNLRYGCGMGKCARCACRVLKGAEHLPEPNWKEKKQLGDERLHEGFRLICQLWLFHDIELDQPTMPLPPLGHALVDPLGRPVANDKTDGNPQATE